jgi:uncharacterized protein
VTNWTLQFEKSVADIGQAEWDRCAGSQNPFVSHAFLSSLEESGCVGEESGWLPFPALLRSESGDLLAALPSYIKRHSQGEYIFDYHWAEAYHRLHREESYYPKLQVAVPYTPVPGPRILLSPQVEPNEARRLLLQGLKDTAQRLDFSSAHMTFCSHEESTAAGLDGEYLLRLGEQYHWFNDNYENFDHYLSVLTSRKRKTIRRERGKANSHGLEIQTVHGHELSEIQLKSFFRLYENTCLRKWGRPYLNLEFFRLLVQKLGERLVLFLVRDDKGSWIAGAWNLRGEDTLFGRNWGACRHYDLLHFEVCYYRAIDYAIKHGLTKVEAGAQGMHKIQRGYRPRAVYSAHYIRSIPFRQAVDQYLHSERLEMEYRLDALSQLEPFKATQDSPAP